MNTKASRPKLSREIVEEASAWFVDFRVGDADQDTRERFDEWLRRSPDHIRAYMEIAKTYVVLPTLDPDRRFDVQELIAYARSGGNVVGLASSPPRGNASATRADRADGPRARNLLQHWLRPRAWVTACALIVAAAGLYAWLTLRGTQTYETGIGERRSLTLADGSTIDLNARSRIRVRLTETRRLVELIDGQALFEVAKDRARPFIVRSGEVQVRAVGTQFDVDHERGSTTVTVLEGRVAVASPNAVGRSRTSSTGPNEFPSGVSVKGEAGAGSAEAGLPVLVQAGEEVVVTGTAVSRPQPAHIAAATAWLQHRFVFDATPLSDVIDDFNRNNPRQIMVADPELRNFHISGVYSSTDPASLIRFLKAQPGVEVIETSEGTRIERH